jgi:hypothetical protein
MYGFVIRALRDSTVALKPAVPVKKEFHETHKSSNTVVCPSEEAEIEEKFEKEWDEIEKRMKGEKVVTPPKERKKRTQKPVIPAPKEVPVKQRKRRDGGLVKANKEDDLQPHQKRDKSKEPPQSHLLPEGPTLTIGGDISGVVEEIELI